MTLKTLTGLGIVLLGPAAQGRASAQQLPASAALLRSEIARLETERNSIDVMTPTVAAGVGGGIAMAGLGSLLFFPFYCLVSYSDSDRESGNENKCLTRSLWAGGGLAVGGAIIMIPSLIVMAVRSSHRRRLEDTVIEKKFQLKNFEHALLPSRQGVQLRLSWRF